MQDFIIEPKQGQFFTPEVLLSVEKGEGKIQGESYLEESFELYDSICQWFIDYFKEHDAFTLDIKLTYFNTSSSRAIIDMLRSLNQFKENGKTVKVKWLYPNPDDDEIYEEGQDFVDEAGMELEFVEYEAED